jgi:hypothetical protein
MKGEEEGRNEGEGSKRGRKKEHYYALKISVLWADNWLDLEGSVHASSPVKHSFT